VFALTAQFPWVTDHEFDKAGIRVDSGLMSDADMAATPTELLNERLHNQQLTGSTRQSPADVVSWMVAMQAQDYPAAKWAIGLRAPRCHEGDVEQAFNDGRILRTHVLRPTWHFVAPEDIRWLLALSAPRVHAVNAYYYRQAGLDARLLNKSCALMHRILEGGQTLTRAEIATHFKRAKIPAEGLKLAYLAIHAELEGVICSGPRRGRQFTYALLDDRAPAANAKPRDEALAELVVRYFASHGPATVRDFSWWSGFSITDTNRAIASVKPALESMKIGELEYWSGDAPPKSRRKAPAYLLPNYDEYLIAYKDRGAYVEAGRAANLVARSNSALSNHLVIDGKLAGSWSRVTGNSLVIQIAPYKKLTPAQMRAVTSAADCYGEFLGMKANFSVV
jgi:hypothetical protein